MIKVDMYDSCEDLPKSLRMTKQKAM